MTAIAEKVNKARKLLYPDDEVMLVMSDEKATEGASLKSIYWWNNYNPHNNYWFAYGRYKISACFVDDGSGIYKLYKRNGSRWSFISNVGSGGYAWTSYAGFVNPKGCKGLCVSGSGCQSDIVMCFYY